MQFFLFQPLKEWARAVKAALPIPENSGLLLVFVVIFRHTRPVSGIPVTIAFGNGFMVGVTAEEQAPEAVGVVALTGRRHTAVTGAVGKNNAAGVAAAEDITAAADTDRITQLSFGFGFIPEPVGIAYTVVVTRSIIVTVGCIAGAAEVGIDLFGTLIGISRRLIAEVTAENQHGRRTVVNIDRSHIAFVIVVVRHTGSLRTVIFVGKTIHMASQTDLLEVVDTIGNTGAFTGCGKRRQQHRRQNGDNGDDNEEFNEGEAQLHPTMVG